MKVLLIKDVHKLGRAGDVKRVADGFGRNFLLPQGLAVLATPGAMKRAENIRTQANAKREVANKEMSGVAERLDKLVLTFPTKASETGKLYGSVTAVMVADAIKKETGIELTRRQLDPEPIRTLGTHKMHIRLTIDLIPQVTVIVHREGETPELPEGASVVKAEPTEMVEEAAANIAAVPAE